MKLLRKISCTFQNSKAGVSGGAFPFPTNPSARFDLNDLKESFYPPVARTSLTSPIYHTKDHVGMWYTIDPARIPSLFGNVGLTKRYQYLTKAFQETCLMIREPTVSIMDYIKKSDLNMPPNKFFMYGDRGVGKTLALAHLVHFLADDGWIIVHLVQPNYWFVQTRVETLPSTTKDDHYDYTVHGGYWLQLFKSQNGPLLEKLGLVTKDDFVWTQRETSPAGTSLLELVDYGIQRARYSSECIIFLIKQLKYWATEGRCKVASVTEGINCLFTPFSLHRRKEDRSLIEVNKFSVVGGFKSLLEQDWKNGVIVGTIDYRCSPMDRRESQLPRYLLRREGWETLEPFVPLKVHDYTDLEFCSVLSYYNDRNFLLRPCSHGEVGKEELRATSASNPLVLAELLKAA